MISNARIVFLCSFTALLAACVGAEDPKTYKAGEGIWENEKFPADKVLTVTRHMTVPAPCWRPPWLAESDQTKEYYRDRLMLDWSNRQLSEGDKNKTSYIGKPGCSRNCCSYLIHIRAVGRISAIYLWVQPADLPVRWNSPLITGTKAMIGINKFANDAIFVYFDEALKEDPGKDDETGRYAGHSINHCKSRPGCWPLLMPSSDKISSMGLSVHLETDSKDAGYREEQYIHSLAFYNQTTPDPFAPKSIYKCLKEKEVTGDKPPLRKMFKRSSNMPYTA